MTFKKVANKKWMKKAKKLLDPHLITLVFCWFMFLIYLKDTVQILINAGEDAVILAGFNAFFVVLYALALYGNFKQKPNFYWPCFVWLVLASVSMTVFSIFHLVQIVNTLFVYYDPKYVRYEKKIQETKLALESGVQSFFYYLALSIAATFFTVVMFKSMKLYRKEIKDAKLAQRMMKLGQTKLFFVQKQSQEV